MDYKKVYDDMVKGAKSKGRKKEKGGPYFEAHHIVPKCLGGPDRKDNIVLLTAKEHLMAHLLLCEIYPNSDSLRASLWLMANVKGKGQEGRVKLSARAYEREKILFAESQRRRIQGKKYSTADPDTNRKLNEARIAANIERPDLGEANKKQATCPHCGKTGGEKAMKRWHFDNCFELTGVKKTHPKIECPHCGHKSQAMIIKKYHGDKCKHNPENVTNKK